MNIDTTSYIDLNVCPDRIDYYLTTMYNSFGSTCLQQYSTLNLYQPSHRIVLL